MELPTGHQPGWELDVSDDETAPASTSESCVVLQSLRQSRDQWMYRAFPKFSGRVRGKPDPVPPPHTIHFRGRCDIEIGPHTFPETSFYEVQYLPPASVAPSFIQSPWQSQYSTAQPNAHPTAPLLSSLASTTSISPELIGRVNAAAASNPTLANLLHLAAAGKGSAEQLQTLGLLIQSLAAPYNPEASSSSAPAPLPQSSPQSQIPTPSTTPVKEFDLVFQYHESSQERWTLPRGPVICEKVADPRAPGLMYDIALTLALAVPSKAPSSSGEMINLQTPSPQVVTMRLKRPPPAIWEAIWKWVGGEEKIHENRKILDNLKKESQRVYLAHQIPESSLLTQLRNATASSHAMKSIKPNAVPPPRPKRKAPQHKPAQQSGNKTPASGSAQSVATTVASSASALTSSRTITGPPPQKRMKFPNPKPVAPLPEIRCVSCQQKDVPLILGGRFCRPCVDTGKAVTVYVPYKPPPNHGTGSESAATSSQTSGTTAVFQVPLPASSQQGS
ncbi:SWR1 complex subunit swc3 [Favolaschia claudopus]|uniref:SWR1 complex subunit swc3 n=1 Tax=Favolaschia claudopus TaxID=2862362 RepID=A0AAW0EH41_9AGAR